MVRKAVMAFDTVAALGADKLARIVLDEAAVNRAFKMRIDAALAAAQGPRAVAAIIDRKLLSLEKSKGAIGSGKARAFAADLETMLRIITGELGAMSPGDAVTRLLRFLRTHEAVSARMDDEDGRVLDIYETATNALHDLAPRLTEVERRGLTASILAMVKGGEWHLRPVTEILAPHLPPDALDALDHGLADEFQKLGEGRERFRREVLIAARQQIAQAKANLDALIELEMVKSAPDPLSIAELLLGAGRAREALDWVRRKQVRTIAFANMAGVADGFIRNSGTLPKVRLEARILEELGDKKAAQALRWAAFEETLDADLLREYVAKLEDFEEFETMDRAFAAAKNSVNRYTALEFFLKWPRLDKAAEFVVEQQAHWHGAHYHVLSEAADALEQDQPMAATVLYRALIDDILGKAKSKAYVHAALYFQALEDLSARFDAASSLDIENPASYRARLQKLHGRKTGFWSLLDLN